jgi:NAD(P)-dependent dehydrogenase (short-subunit alcohol dehydrogenase family)
LLTTLPQSKTQIAWWTKLARQTERQFAIHGNVAKKGEVERLFTQAEKAFGKIDILVNNASVYEFVSLEEIPGRNRRTGRRKTPAAGPTERPACNSSQFSDTTTDVLSAAPVCKNLYKSDLNFNHPFNTEQNYRI